MYWVKVHCDSTVGLSASVDSVVKSRTYQPSSRVDPEPISLLDDCVIQKITVFSFALIVNSLKHEARLNVI
jgi:hypothetical protein